MAFPPFRARQEELHHPRQQQAEAENEELQRRDPQRPELIARVGKVGVEAHRIRTEGEADDFQDDGADRDGTDQRNEVRRVAQRLQGDAFDREREHEDEQQRQRHPNECRKAKLHARPIGEERAQHIELAVRHVQQTKHAEGQREADGDQRVDTAQDNPVRELLDQEFHRSGPASEKRLPTEPAWLGSRPTTRTPCPSRPAG